MNLIPLLPEDRQTTFSILAMRHAGAALAVAVATMTGLLIAQRWGNQPVVLLYIPSVLAAAVYGGLWPALLAAVLSTLAFNYYFTAPYRTLIIHSPADVVTVIILFLVALVTSQLAGKLRDQAWLARTHAARDATIAGFARHLLSCPDERAVADITVQELSRLFLCNVVLVSAGDMPRVMAAAPPGIPLAPSDLAAADMTIATGKPTGRGVQLLNLVDWHFRPITSSQAVLAAVGMARDDGAPPIPEPQLALLDNLLDQLALALERARLDAEAREFATLRERDRLRSTLLASIGEDVTPRLNSIAEAARALRRSGTADKTLVARVATEVVKLDQYIETLVELEPGADQDPKVFGDLTIDLHRRCVSRQDHEIHLTPKEFAVLAELAKHAGRVLTHAHLLRTVWGPAHVEQIDYLRVVIRALRQKLESEPARPMMILNEPAVGYKLALS